MAVTSSDTLKRSARDPGGGTPTACVTLSGVAIQEWEVRTTYRKTCKHPFGTLLISNRRRVFSALA